MKSHSIPSGGFAMKSSNEKISGMDTTSFCLEINIAIAHFIYVENNNFNCHISTSKLLYLR
ncbi:hypothetical protein [Nostoc sp. ChiVER01]|uniref:hypothetical protein n=1 Tax=Nostoc sp. ChiVER01 TaxID=3075382 RepID=UPI003A0FE16C